MTQTKRMKRIIQQAKTDYTNEYVKHQLRFYYEQKLALEVSKIFAKMEKMILQELHENYNPGVMYQAQVDMILSPIHELHREYFETILKYQLKEYDNARATGRKIVKYKIGFKRKGNVLPKTRVLKADLTDAVTSTINKDELFGTLDVSHYDLEQRTYALCENTLRRVDQDINNIVANGYREGMGIDKVGRDITKRFGQLKTWEANRIARTEIHISHNQGLMQGYYDMDVEYLEWSTSIDGRERDSHREIDGEIIPIGGTFSNGLRYPGDSNGIPSEIINCRCQVLPFIMPYDCIAPNFSPFRESDLVRVDTPDIGVMIEDTVAPTITEPSLEQLQSNLTKQELEQVEWAKSVLSKEFHTVKMKEKARNTLTELYAKASGKTVTIKPAVVEKPKSTIVDVIKKPTKDPGDIGSMTSEELYQSMTKADKKKYDKAKQKLATVEKNIKTIGENDLLLGMKKDRLLEIKQLEQKQINKLQNKGKRKPKEKVVRTHERTLDNIHTDIEIPTDDLIPNLEKWIDKRCKNTSEFGYNFNIKDGSIINGLKKGEIRGTKGHIRMGDLGAETGSIHSHPRNGMSTPSIEDLETFRCKQQDHHFMVSEHEIWYVHATDRFGIGGMGQQLDLQSAHKACRNKAFEKVAKEIKKGKLEATEEAIAKKLDEYTGDEILKTFNSPPWNKTMTVKRYYR